MIQWLGEPARLTEPWLGQVVVSTHATARPAIVRGFREVFGRDPSLQEAQFAQGVACVETGGTYDATFYVNRQTGERITGTHNWGGIHCVDNPPCPPDCFEGTDAGKLVCFRRYATLEDGVRGFVRTLYGGRRSSVLRAASFGSASAVATAMKQTGYYTAPLSEYTAALAGCVQRIARALGESAPAAGAVPAGRGNILPALVIAGAGLAIYYATIR